MLVDKQKKPQQQTGHSLFIPIYIQYLYYSRNLEQTASKPDFQSQRLSVYAASPPLYPSASSSVKLQDPQKATPIAGLVPKSPDAVESSHSSCLER